MRKLLTAIAIVVFCLPLYGQQGTRVIPIEGSTRYIQITLTNTGNDTVDVVNVLFPNSRRTWYISETLPTYITGNVSHNAYWTGATELLWQCAGTGADDSLSFMLKPLCWDPVDNEYAVIENDSTWLNPTGLTSNGYSAAQVYFDYTDAVEYHINLNGLTWAMEGFELTVSTKDEGTFSKVVNIWFNVVQ